MSGESIHLNKTYGVKRISRCLCHKYQKNLGVGLSAQF